MKKIFTLVLATMLLIAPQVVRCQEELTVYENATATSTHVPVNGTWTDAYLKCEFVIPSDQLEEMDGGTVSQMTFFLTIPAGAAWVGTFQVFLKEVDNTTINAYYGPDNATVVYEGNLDGSQSTMNVEFNETYTYGGGNLLVGVYQIDEGNYKAATFAGESITGACVQGYSGSSLDAVTVNQRNFIPKTKFTYTPDSGGGLVCEKPTGITTSNITSNSATVNWTGDGSAFNLQYKASNTTDWTEVNGLSGVSYNLTGLTSNTTYNVRVQQVCEEGTSTWKSATFNTPLGIPMIEPFDATSIPTGWAQYTGLLSNVLNGSILASATYGWNFGNKNGTFDSHAYVNVYGTGCQRWLVSPVLQMEDNVVLSFDMALTAYGGTLGTPGANGVDDKFAVLITTDGGSTWEILRQWDNNGSEYVYNNIPCSADGENVSFDLSSYAGQNIAIAFYGESTVSNADNNLHIDNVRIDYGLPCKRPTGLAVTEVAPNSAILSWNENGSATAWQLCLNEDTTNLVTADTNPFTLTGLTAGTAYTVKVRAYCDSIVQSSWTSAISFTTPHVIPFVEPFDATSIPTGWTSSGSSWSFGNANGAFDSHAYAYMQRTPYNSSINRWLISPTVQIEDGVKLSFDMTLTANIGTLAPPETSSSDKFVVQITTDGGSTWEILRQWDNAGSDYVYNNISCSAEGENVSIELSSYIGQNIAVAFYVESTLGSTAHTLHIDNVHIDYGLPCKRPTGLAATDVTLTSATVTWTGEGNTFNLQYKASNATDWTGVGGLSGFSYNLTGLTSNTTYYVRVQQVCDEDTSSWRTTTFTTPMGIPLVETFDATNCPSIWTSSYWNFGSNNGVFDNHAYCYTSYARLNAWLVSPTVRMENGVFLSFDMALTSSMGTSTPQGGAHDKFEVLITADGGSTWEILRQWDNNGSEYVYNNIPCSADGENVSFDLSSYAGQNIAIAFYVETLGYPGNNYLHIDNVRIDYSLPCKRPTGLVATDVTTNSATLSWTESGIATAWQICLNNDTTNFIDVTSNPYTLSALTEGTSYSVMVRANCGNEDASDWSIPVTFTTCRHFTSEFEATICENALPYVWNEVSYNASGDYTQTFLTAANCDSVVTLHLTVLPPPVIEIARAAGHSATVCEGAATAIEAVVTGGYGEVTSYLWWENGNLLPGETNAVLNIDNLAPNANDIYTVEVAQEGAGCYNSAAATLDTLVTVYPQFTVSVSAPATVCDNGTLTLTATMNNASDEDELTYLWYGVPTSGANAAIYTTDNLQAGLYDCFVAVTGNVSGCYDESEPVHVEILPTYHTTLYDTICQGFNYDFFGQTLTESGPYTHILQAANGCDSVITLELTVYPVYTVAVTASGTTVCEGNTLTLNADVQGVIPNDVPAYQWYQTLGGNQVAVNGAASTSYSTSDLLANNTYEFFLTLTSNIKGCSVVSNTVAATVVPLPSVTITGDTNVNLGQSAALTALGANTYTWSDGNATIGNDASVTVSPEVPTTYSVTGTDQYGCTGTASVTVTVNYPPTVTTDAVSDIMAYSATCGGNVTAEGSAEVTGRGVCWSTSHNPTLDNAHTADNTGTGTFTSAMTELSRGTTYYVRAYATNSVGTAYGEEVAFTTAFCPYPVTFDTAVCANAMPLTWHGHTFEEEGTYSATYQTAVGCDSVVTISLTVLPSLVGQFMDMTPANSAEISNYPINFTWNAVANAPGYDLYVWPAGEPQPQQPMVSQIHGTQYTLSELPNNTNYQWLVKTFNTCDTVTSAIRQFSLNVTPELTVTSDNPVDFGEVPFNSTRSVFFQVNGTALDNPISYQLTGADASSFSLAPVNTWDELHGGRMQLSFHPTIPQSDYTAQMTFQSGNFVETVTVTGALSDFYAFNTYVDDEVYAMDSVVPIHGQVINLLDEPVAGLNVEVYVKVMDYVRTFPATTNANGQFTVMFTPQRSEAGYYTVGSRKAGSSNSMVEHDEFNIPGMMLTSSDWILWTPTLDQADTGVIAVRNRSRLPLTNIQVTPLSLPNGCTVQFLPLNLAGMATGELQYIVSGSQVSTGVNYEEVPLSAVSDEGATMDFSAWYYCIQQRADLEVLPMSLVTTMTRGKSKVVDFMIYNNGTGSTGNIYVSLPDVPWMSVVGSDTLPSLAAHDSAYVSIRLSADDETDLVRYTGSFSIHCERGEGVNIPYNITAISDSTGTLVVDVTDEYAWNTNNGHGPHLAGANVTVKGYYSLETVATGVTDENGMFVAENLPEGWYRLIIRANRHAEYQNNLYITAGDTNLQDIFIPFQAITYYWDVVPTEIEDVYTYELNVEFETHVPKPVVTMDIDRTLPLLEDCETGVFNVLATNHGLVAAMDVSVVVPQSDYFVFTPLVSHIDSLPALTTYTIPVTYQRKSCTESKHLMFASKAPSKAKAPDYYDGISCEKDMFNLTYYYICRITHWETVISGDIKYDQIQEICGGDTSRPVVPVPQPSPSPDITSVSPDITDIVINPDWVRNYPYINLPNLTGYEPGAKKDTDWVLPDVLKFCDPNLTPCQNALNGVSGCVPVLPSNMSIDSHNEIHIDEFANKVDQAKEDLTAMVAYYGVGLILDLINIADQMGCMASILYNYPNIKTCIQSWTNPHTASEIRDRDIATIVNICKHLAWTYVKDQDFQEGLEEIVQPNSNDINPTKTSGLLAKKSGASAANILHQPSLSQNNAIFNEGYITNAGRAQILAECLEMDDSPGVEEFVNAFIDRWNHSMEAWDSGYFTAADAPEGYDTNFIQLDTNLLRELHELNQEALLQGYANIFERFDGSVNALHEAMDEYRENQHSSSLCATVTVQFSQKMTMTREAFEGTLTINNGNEDNPIQDIDVDFVIRDENGVDCTNLFQINFLSYNNMTGTNGNASLDAQSEGSIIVQFIPTKQAAPEIAKVYSFGGTLSFIDPFTGEYMTNNLYPVDIWVHPSPDLYVNYFMQRDILGDDPLTEEKVEPIVPAELGVIIHNRGAGVAKNVILETAEPRIIDNEKGLAIDFAMYGAAFNGNERQLGLMAIPFGNIEPNRTGVGEWWFTSTLLGHFVSYEAHVIHNSSFGNPDLSLVSSLQIHPLIHTVYAYGNLDDGINDFLVDDVDDYRHYPDSLYFSNGSRTAVAIADSIGLDHYVTPLDTIVQLTLDPSRIGWNYEQTWDPGRGQYKLISCTRNSDQQVIPLSNVWQSFVTLPVGGDPVYEDRLHIVDTLNTNQPTTYTLVFSLHDIVLSVDTIQNVPDSVISTPLSEVTVKFNKPIVDSTFNYSDISLKCNNGGNIVDNNLNMERIDSVTYKLHLEPYTQQSGYYVLDIRTLDITDIQGFNGYYTKRATWTQNINTCQPDSVSITKIVCDSYTWKGISYTESGDYTRNFFNTAGCDSVVTLHLTVNHSNTGDTTAVACNSFDWYEQTGITESGDYTHIFTNANGCDSVVTLHLTVTPCDPDAVVVTIVGHTGTNGYDGSEHSVSGFDVTAIEIGGEATALYTEADFSLKTTVTATASRTNAGQTNMGLTAESFVNNNTDFETVVFLVTDGWQRIGKRSITISLDSNKVYDGEVFTVNADQLHVTGLLEGQTLTGQLWTEEADPGVYVNHNGLFQATLDAGVIYSSLAVQDTTSSNVTSNYTPAFDVTLIIEGAPQPCTGVTYQGHDYDAVQIGSQCWLAENLRWATGDHHAYKDEADNLSKFGYLYSWYTTVGVTEGDNDAVPPTLTADDGTPYVQGICPPGWAVPSMADIAELNLVPGGTAVLKDPSSEYWFSGYEGIPGGTGFNARGGGRYNAALNRYEDLMTANHFWASDATPGKITILSACVAYYCGQIILTDPNQKNDRKSVRCLRKSL